MIQPAPDRSPPGVIADLDEPPEESSAGSSLIQLHHIGKRYGRVNVVEAIAGVDLQIAQREFVCLVGPSGCGKSTLLRLIAGIHRPSSGEVVVHGLSGRAARSAMVFQSYGIFPWKTVRANVRFGLDLRRCNRRDADARVDEWLGRMGLQDFGDAYPAQLSGGMRQRVSIARALVTEPDILLMDEPFAALDAQLRRLLQEELLDLWQEHSRTVVFVTHSIDEAIFLGDRVVVMSRRPGRIIGDYPVPLPRPRGPEVRAHPEFGQLANTLWEQLRQEVHDDGEPR